MHPKWARYYKTRASTIASEEKGRLRCEKCIAKAPCNADMLSNRRRVRRVGYMRRERSAVVRSSSEKHSWFYERMLNLRVGSRPPVHPLVALDDFLDLLFCDLLDSVSIAMLVPCAFVHDLPPRHDLLKPSLPLKQTSIKTQVRIFQQFLLHVRGQRCRLADTGGLL
jgi:hypothetical protein